VAERDTLSSPPSNGVTNMKTVSNIYFIHDDGTAEMKCGNSIVRLDADKVDLVSKFKWSIGSHGYPTSGCGKNQKLMHRLIFEVDRGSIIDHINRDKLDNRVANLRIATFQENMSNKEVSTVNTSGYKGICRTTDGKWQAQICKDRRSIYLGRYESAELAAQAYDTAARTIHGEFAATNFEATDFVQPTIKHNHKLTASQVFDIRKLFDTGFTILN